MILLSGFGIKSNRGLLKWVGKYTLVCFLEECVRVVVISSLNVSGILQRSYLGLEFSFFFFITVNLISLIMRANSGSLSFFFFLRVYFPFTNQISSGDVVHQILKCCNSGLRHSIRKRSKSRAHICSFSILSYFNYSLKLLFIFFIYFLNFILFLNFT